MVGLLGRNRRYLIRYSGTHHLTTTLDMRSSVDDCTWSLRSLLTSFNHYIAYELLSELYYGIRVLYFSYWGGQGQLTWEIVHRSAEFWSNSSLLHLSCAVLVLLVKEIVPATWRVCFQVRTSFSLFHDRASSPNRSENVSCRLTFLASLCTTSSVCRRSYFETCVQSRLQVIQGVWNLANDNRLVARLLIYYIESSYSWWWHDFGSGYTAEIVLFRNHGNSYAT